MKKIITSIVSRPFHPWYTPIHGIIKHSGLNAKIKQCSKKAGRVCLCEGCDGAATLFSLLWRVRFLTEITPHEFSMWPAFYQCDYCPAWIITGSWCVISIYTVGNRHYLIYCIYTFFKCENETCVIHLTNIWSHTDYAYTLQQDAIKEQVDQGMQ